jgi:hypothetical protein
MSYRARADVYGEANLDRLIVQADALDGPAQIAKEARAAVPVVRLLYLGGYDVTRAPSGAPWVKRKRSYPHPLLVKTPGSGMRDTTRFVAEADGVRVVVPAPHAEYQHDGTATIEARPIVPVDDLGKWAEPIGLARRAVGYDLE